MTTGINNNGRNSLGYILQMGAMRSLIVNVITYPLEMIKTNQQIDASSRARVIANKLFAKYGVRGFFHGFASHFLKGVVKQTVWWPVIAYLPPFLSKHNLSSNQKSIATGTSVAILDALINSPLEKSRVLASLGKKSPFADFSSIKRGWSGFFSYFRRQAITWSLFFIGQHHFNKPYKEDNGGQRLTIFQITSTSSKMSLLANLFINPFDTLNTLKQSNSKELKSTPTLSLLRVRRLYRGLPLNFLSMMIQLSATIFLIDVIETNRPLIDSRKAKEKLYE